MNSISDITDKLKRPIEFASRNSYNNLNRLKGVERLIEGVASEAFRSDVPEDIQLLFRELVEMMAGFDDLTESDKKDILSRSIRILKDIEGLNQGHRVRAGPILRVIDKKVDSSIGEIKKRDKALNTPIQFIKGVGPKIAGRLNKKDVESVRHMLDYFPRAYEDRRHFKRISTLKRGEKETIYATVLLKGMVETRRRRRIFEVVVGDSSGHLSAKWFQYSPSLTKIFKKGQGIVMTGVVSSFAGNREMYHPDFEIVKEEEGMEKESLDFNRIVPIYSETAGLNTKRIRRIIKKTLDNYKEFIYSGIPTPVLRRKGLIDIGEAFLRVHFPLEGDDVALLNRMNSEAHRRLIFEEFFFLSLGLALKRRGIEVERGISLDTQSLMKERFLKSLPFELTKAQRRVVGELEGDMAGPRPMNRLIQGDVGVGKTVVAFIAAIIAAYNGYQTAVMAPTTVLAEQHFNTFRNWAQITGMNVCLLTSEMGSREKLKTLERVKSGDTEIVVGTHALIQEEVDFFKLGLAIIDEQHKFEVFQRAMIKAKGVMPDVLVISATPIPRTLALTVYGDLDISYIDEMPPGRSPVITKVFMEDRRDDAYGLINREIRDGRQAYLVYPLVEESENLDLKDATRMAERLKKEVFPDLKIALVHGRSSQKEKEEVMRNFLKREIQMLVTTTVIEVGLDIPNATVMLVEHAQRFGLSQLHQLRGRVGRGRHQSYCLLLCDDTLSRDASERLHVMEGTNDGFRVAEEDLRIRGPGEFLGVRQSGLPDFRMANLVRDSRILKEAREEALRVVAGEEDVEEEEYKIMMHVLKEMWGDRLDLANVG